MAEFSTARLLAKVKNDLPNFFGFQFEKFVLDWFWRQCLAKPQQFPFDQAGKYWDKGANEIDVVAYQENGDLCLIGECKWNSKRVKSEVVAKLAQSIEVIERKRNFKKFIKAVFVGDRMPAKLKESLVRQDIQVFEMAEYW